MEIKIESLIWGDVIVKDVMIDSDFNMIEEGVSIISDLGEFKGFDVIGYCTDYFEGDIDDILDDLITKNVIKN